MATTMTNETNQAYEAPRATAPAVKTAYEAKAQAEAKHLEANPPRPEALSPEQVQGLGISYQTAVWISTYTKVNELYSWLVYAYATMYGEKYSDDVMERAGVTALWSQLGDKILEEVGDSVCHKIGLVSPSTI